MIIDLTALASPVFQSTSSEEDVVSVGIATHKTATQGVSIHVLRRGRCVSEYGSFPIPNILAFQSTSSEEDVVSYSFFATPMPELSFNPRPPKRTLCRAKHGTICGGILVSIHVLRRGRCVAIIYFYHN